VERSLEILSTIANPQRRSLWSRFGWEGTRGRGRASSGGDCRRRHALLPDLVLARRLDGVAVIGCGIALRVIANVGLRPIATQLDVPHSTVRTWWHRFRARSPTTLAPLQRPRRGAGWHRRHAGLCRNSRVPRPTVVPTETSDGLLVVGNVDGQRPLPSPPAQYGRPLKRVQRGTVMRMIGPDVEAAGVPGRHVETPDRLGREHR